MSIENLFGGDQIVDQGEQYVEVLLPLPLAPAYTYRLPAHLARSVQIGSRVLVPFGAKKYYTGIVVALVTDTESLRTVELKSVSRVDDPMPVVLRHQLQLWQWISDYFMSPIGSVYKAAVPAGLRNEDDGVRYKPKTQVFVELNVDVHNTLLMESMFKQLNRSPKQLELWMHFLQLSQAMNQAEPLDVPRSRLCEQIDPSYTLVKGLEKKGLVRLVDRAVSRLISYRRLCEPSKALSEKQEKAYWEIHRSFKERPTTLLWGVTSSGKTEIYIRLIEDALALGKQVLYLVPEIALTTQLTERLQRVFGQKLGIYHSKFSDAERVEIWQKQLSSEPFPVILGVRSSVFLPFKKLGLVIVDEEHEQTYKQQDPAPRYHARSAALVLASFFGAKSLLGSATPSLETYYNGITGKYGLVKLFSRYEDVQLPEIHAVNIAELRRKRIMKSPFSPLLLEKMQQALDLGEQTILFQNRRGYARFVECYSCGWVPRCKVCDVSLTFHKGGERPDLGEHLSCHYCGAIHHKPTVCQQCGGHHVNARGMGTERIEEEIKTFFPDYAVERMDLDTTRNKHALSDMITRFQQRDSHILVGTQIVTKGLDFDHVSLVGILNADQMMNLPDFRAYERTFQLCSQVAGRAGRRNKQGTVVLQTSQSEHPLIGQIVRQDYDAFYTEQLNERQLFNYPPFTRLIYIYLRHRDEELLDRLSRDYTTRLRSLFGSRILGPEAPPVSRIHSLYIRKILVKIEVKASIKKAQAFLEELRQAMLDEQPEFKKIDLFYDVEPF